VDHPWRVTSMIGETAVAAPDHGNDAGPVQGRPALFVGGGLTSDIHDDREVRS